MRLSRVLIASVMLLRSCCGAFVPKGKFWLKSTPVSRQHHFQSAVHVGLRTLLLSLAARPIPKASLAAASSTAAVAAEVVKSPIDEREYLAFTLPNGLRVLLISDPDSSRAAAALDVHVGSFCDPQNIPGLAHFCGEFYPMKDII